MTTVRQITREVLENYIQCKTKGFLTLTGEFGTKTDYEAWRLKAVTQQRVNTAANFISHYRGHTLREDVVLTATAIITGPDVILRAQFDNELISLPFDALVRGERSGIRQNQFAYIPILFEDAKIKMAQKVLLGLFALILSELQEKEPTIGLVFHQRGRPTTIRFADGLKIARRIMSEIRGLQQSLAPPMLVLNDHCQVCEFRGRCHAQAIKEDNLSLLRGVDEGQVARLNAKGIFTVNQLSYTFRARRRPKRAKKSTLVHHIPLRALALREKKIFVHGDPVITVSHTRVYLDIEGTPQDRTYYLIGLHAISGEHGTRAAYWAETQVTAQPPLRTEAPPRIALIA
jgi:predicted RecB family nuclease